MSTPGPNRDAIRPELLAAYVDDELDGPTRARVEAWLESHPEAFDELFGQQRLSRQNEALWQATAPPMPDESAWADVCAGIENALADPQPESVPIGSARSASRRRGRPGLFLGLAAGVAAAAASVVLALSVSFNRPPAPPGPPLPAPEVAEEDEPLVLPLASAGEVEIISLPEADADLILVGDHPAKDDPLVLAAAEDVLLYELAPDPTGLSPQMPMTPNDGDLPMIVAPLLKP